MKITISIILLFALSPIFAQSKIENEVTQLSKSLFNWEVKNNIDSIDNLLHEKLIVVNSKGETLSKSQYLATFQSGTMTHNSIEIEESKTTILNNTAIVAGKGIFNITAGGNNMIRHLSYIETFIKTKDGWKLLALKASVIPN
ncbi:MAG: nuclear transport factor 2 family protein [Bacteroidetes bacterium]|nr:nuclear transport factor 2 family protein [Bacteroidota bacterium]